jgi:hypothetical protein
MSADSLGPYKHLLDAKHGVEVPGGVVVIDMYRGMAPLRFWIRSLTSVLWRVQYAAKFLERDIVILDSSRRRELYREGPYNNITVNRPLERLLAEIENVGLDQFLRIRQIQSSRVGPLSVDQKPLGFIQSIRPYLSSRFGLITRRSQSSE